MAANGVLGVQWKLKMGDLSARAQSWNLFDSAQEQSTAFVNWHSECSQEERKKQKNKKARTVCF